VDDSYNVDRCVRDFVTHTPTMHENFSHLVLAFIFRYTASLSGLIRQSHGTHKEPFNDLTCIVWRVPPDEVCNLRKFAQNA